MFIFFIFKAISGHGERFFMKLFLIIVGIITLIILLVCSISIVYLGFTATLSVDKGEVFYTYWPNLLTNVVIGIIIAICILAYTLVPSTKALAAGYVASSIIDNKELQKIPDKVFNILNIKLDDIQKNLIK